MTFTESMAKKLGELFSSEPTGPTLITWQYLFLCSKCNNTSYYKVEMCHKCGNEKHVRQKVEIKKVGDVDFWREYYRINGKGEWIHRGYFGSGY